MIDRFNPRDCEINGRSKGSGKQKEEAEGDKWKAAVTWALTRVEMTQPTVKWAQRKDRLFLTVDIQDIADEKVALTAEKVIITGKVRSKGES